MAMAIEEGILSDASIATETALQSLLDFLITDQEVRININFQEQSDTILPDNCQ